MNPKLPALVLVTLAFAALTVKALLEGGLAGILSAAFATWANAQIFFDLVIVCTLAIIWMIVDGRRRATNPWPFVVLTLVAGSFGPLLYLIWRERAAASTAPDGITGTGPRTDARRDAE